MLDVCFVILDTVSFKSPTWSEDGPPSAPCVAIALVDGSLLLAPTVVAAAVASATPCKKHAKHNRGMFDFKKFTKVQYNKINLMLD